MITSFSIFLMISGFSCLLATFVPLAIKEGVSWFPYDLSEFEP